MYHTDKLHFKYCLTVQNFKSLSYDFLNLYSNHNILFLMPFELQICSRSNASICGRRVICFAWLLRMES